MSSQRSSGIAKGKGIAEYDPAMDNLSKSMFGVSLEPSKGGSSAARPTSTLNPNARAWTHPNAVQMVGTQSNNASKPAGSWASVVACPGGTAGRGSGTTQASRQVILGTQRAQGPVAPAPFNHGSNLPARAASTELSQNFAGRNQNYQNHTPIVFDNTKSDGGDKDDDDVDDVDDDDDDDDDDDEDDDDFDDGFESDSSAKSHETKKKNKWFKDLFVSMDKLTVEQLSDPERRWHCPACRDGPGAIDWYKGLQPVITHAKTKGTSRVKIHRELAQLLQEELKIRGTSAIPAGEFFGKWKGLENEKEKQIVWPPMVIIMNTQLDKDEDDKWLGMGNQELLNNFSNYDPKKARHAYGPRGHRGMSLLIFDATAVGYLEAERLSQHFTDNGRDRDAWDRRRVPFYPGGDRPLYGFMAERSDMEIFNKHCQGKTKLKYEMKSYTEMVVKQLRQMNEDNQHLLFYKNKVAKEQRLAKALEESYGVLSEKLRKTEEDSRTVRLRTKIHNEEKKEEMDFQEQFFKEQIQAMYDARVAKEDTFEKIQQEKRNEITQAPSIAAAVDPNYRAKEIEKFISVQDKEMDEFVGLRDRLLKEHEERMLAMKQRHWGETVAMEQQLDAALVRLMENYLPDGKQHK